MQPQLLVARRGAPKDNLLLRLRKIQQGYSRPAERFFDEILEDFALVVAVDSVPVASLTGKI